jgi:hypothetical protein
MDRRGGVAPNELSSFFARIVCALLPVALLTPSYAARPAFEKIPERNSYPA